MGAILSQVNLNLGDCLDYMKSQPENSFDAIVTDPPYGIQFLGEAWDHGVPAMEVWAEALRVLKPGGHLLAFASTRTNHRMAVNIEDAGFKIRDMLMWVFGAGFPKGHNIAQGIDRLDAMDERRVRALAFTEWARSTGVSASDIDRVDAASSMGSHYLTQGQQPQVPTPEIWKKISHLFPKPPEGILDLIHNRDVESENFAAREVVGQHEKNISDSLFRDPGSGRRLGGAKTLPHTPEAQEWDEWNTTLRPGFEPITLAQKPISESTIARNVIKWRTGGINIKGCRIEGGRFPSNLLHDGHQQILDLFPGSGVESASRFFYCPKASKADREHGLDDLKEVAGGSYQFRIDGSLDGKIPMRRNTHKTVKPTALMRYLVRLVTPPGGSVLDPFMGSGSTGRGAKMEGFDFTGCELSEEFLDISRRRISAAKRIGGTE